jgi:hypothetical protein
MMGGTPGMMRSALRNLGHDQMILLAPPLAKPPAGFDSVQMDSLRHGCLLAEAQRLRGDVYLRDGAIGPHNLSADGRLVHNQDERSWQLLVLNSEGKVSGCARYSPQEHHLRFSQLGIARSALASSRNWGHRLQQAVEAKRAEARKRGFGYAELGGWALQEESRHRGAAFRISVNIYGLMKMLGGALATTTATFRHRSSAILRKMGGYGLFSGGEELPSYYDPQYECEMEILGFDSDKPNPKYSTWIHECQRRLKHLTVVCSGLPCEDWRTPEPEYQRGSLN